MCGGQAQGTAIANIISGQYNPSGKLPITWPRSAATLPAYYSFPNGGHPGSWWDIKVRKRDFAPFETKRRTFAKTGWGQTSGKLRERDVFCSSSTR
jgi:hypothetical protein